MTAAVSKESDNARSFSRKLAISVVLVVLITAVAYMIWSQFSQDSVINSKALAEARTLNTEMYAVWGYIDDSQDAINYNSDGIYDFKGIYCSMAGKAIAQRFTRDSDGYAIRYVRNNPRSSTDEPDEFEQKALASFVSGDSAELYEMTEYDGRPVFRYVSALFITRNCLECHGEPAGTPDETGFMREGMKLDDVAGAVSIVIPMDSYASESHSDFVRSVIFFCFLAFAMVSVVLLAMRRWALIPLEGAKHQLEHENEQKSNYLAMMSHELRTPLTSIIAYTDIWEKASSSDLASQEQYAHEIRQNSTQLLEMVNNTIDVARFDEGCFELQWDDVDLFDVVGEVMTTSAPLALKRGVALTSEIQHETPIIYSDAEALRKILLNLVSNAIKFTDDGGRVALSVKYKEAFDTVRIEVVDSGIGIKQEDLASIFDKYSQVGKPDGNKGSGIGLFLVKKLTEELHGEVSVVSKVGQGSTFSVELPIGCGNRF